MIRNIFILSLFLFCHASLAQTCPTVKDLQHSLPSGWKAIDSDDGGELSAGRETQFRKMAQEFALVEWIKKDAQSGAIRCYYRDKNGSDLEAFLIKEDFMPANKNDYWYQVSGSMQCAAGMDKCNFETGKPQNQLARK